RGDQARRQRACTRAFAMWGLCIESGSVRIDGELKIGTLHLPSASRQWIAGKAVGYSGRGQRRRLPSRRRPKAKPATTAVQSVVVGSAKAIIPAPGLGVCSRARLVAHRQDSGPANEARVLQAVCPPGGTKISIIQSR